MIAVHETSDGVSFAVKVQPRARKNGISGEFGDALKLSITAPPSEGRANVACIAFLANLLEVPRSSVTIASGESSRRKVIRVQGLSAEADGKGLGCDGVASETHPALGRTPALRLRINELIFF
ncbi:MAG: DUF167 domain-containing protein [Terriglobales bacterium]